VFRINALALACQALPTSIFVLFMGPWSDKFGRKFIMLYPFFGMILQV